ncbi:ATP-dependent RNA helicase DEAD-box, conserved site [Artemisia annua]|uniref:ATP-dependent RNA helicase DEAD-box, conserved site n=1 Tax=Artemisia annua TaxID=35608 RepID=A0A2U1KBY9_ARTAN|nr:ATP-dependent RNA helicase DEAD-box, conserved site [Artemisia annua]
MDTTRGMSSKDDIMRLYQPVHLLFGTPRRIIDLSKKQICKLDNCTMLVMDEVSVMKRFRHPKSSFVTSTVRSKKINGFGGLFSRKTKHAASLLWIETEDRPGLLLEVIKMTVESAEIDTENKVDQGQGRDNQVWNRHRNFNNRYNNMQPQRGINRKGAYMQPAVHNAAPFVHLPMRPFGNNVMYPGEVLMLDHQMSRLLDIVTNIQESFSIKEIPVIVLSSENVTMFKLRGELAIPNTQEQNCYTEHTSAHLVLRRHLGIKVYLVMSYGWMLITFDQLYRTHQCAFSIAKTFRDKGIPCDVVWMDVDHI